MFMVKYTTRKPVIADRVVQREHIPSELKKIIGMRGFHIPVDFCKYNCGVQYWVPYQKKWIMWVPQLKVQ